jgi:hypothetical protein
MNLASFLHNHFRFTANRPLDIRLLEGPISRYPIFISTTIQMILAVTTGALLVGLYWTVLSPLVRVLLLLSLTFLVGTWARSIWDHATLKRAMTEIGPLRADSEPFKLAATGIYSGPSALFGTALVLYMSFLMTLYHLEKFMNGQTR